MIFNNDLYIAKVTVEEYGAENGGRRFYNLKGIKIEPAGGQLGITSSSSRPDTDSTISVSDLYALVKGYDKDFKSQPSSKVVNSNLHQRIFRSPKNGRKSSIPNSAQSLRSSVHGSATGARMILERRML